jgi:Cytochrome c
MYTTVGSRSNRPSRFWRAGLAGSALMLVLALSSSAQTQSAQASQAMPSSPADRAALVAHGEYLANSVAMCVQCHSPRDEEGNILELQKFSGAPMPVRSPFPDEQWALRAPNIRGLPGFTDEQIIALLTTGHATGRQPPLRPMPPFRMDLHDAQAIVAYLRSL